MPLISVVLGSDFDLPKVRSCFDLLEEFGVSFEVVISSAHRTPEKTREWAATLRARGVKAVIAVAGGAAHLPGVVAAVTTLPVIGVPIETAIGGGLDSILSILQMPAGIPVATMPAGRSGGANAALFAIALLATTDSSLETKLDSYRKKMAEGIIEKSEKLQKIGYREYIKGLETK
ncbi:MAG TPA: 5-(carboxyamino)imidazole ribonucleotide mutase [Spirochaetota bacterium]|nr:5-(carboxyamino)imidazole ribonucleotide mutase [Spirochaetota bacterium]